MGSNKKQLEEKNPAVVMILVIGMGNVEYGTQVLSGSITQNCAIISHQILIVSTNSLLSKKDHAKDIKGAKDGILTLFSY